MSPISDHVADQVDDLIHGLVDGENAARIASHCAICPACLTALEAAQQRLTALRAVPSAEVPAPLVERTVQKIREQGRPRLRVRRRILTAAAVFVVALLTLGGVHAHYAYLKPTPGDLVLLGQSEWITDTDASVRIRLVDRNTGAPIAGRPVTMKLLRPGSAPYAFVFKNGLTTDAQGGAEPHFHVPDWPDDSYEFTVTAGDETITRQVQLKRSWQILLSTDKPVYQPGQTIRMRALALRQPDFKPVAGESATFTVSDPRGNVIFKETTTTSRFGIAGVSKHDDKVEEIACSLADETTEGTWTIACRVGNAESRRAVEVFRYVLPKYKIDIKPSNTVYGPGSVAHVDVKATYFTGKPVVDAKVTLTPNMVEQGVKIPPLETKTDAEGSAGFDVQLPSGLGDNARVHWQVSVDDGGRTPQQGQVDCVISDRPVHIDVLPEGGTLVEGVPNTVYFLVTHADGRPLPLKLSADGLGTLQCDVAGIASAVVTPTGLETRWTIRGYDDKGDLQMVQSVKLLSGQMADDFLIRTDKAVYRGGDTVRLTALGQGEKPVYVDLNYLGDRRITLLTQTVALKDGQGAVSFPLPAEANGTLEICAYRFTGDQRRIAVSDNSDKFTPRQLMGVGIHKTRLICVQPASDLQIRTTFNKPDGYRPREKARLDFQLLDAAGKPHVGALSLTAVDSAVYAVLAQRPGQERSLLAMHGEHLRPITDVAPNWVPGEQAQRDQALLARTARSMSDPSGGQWTLHSLIGDSYTAKIAQAQLTQRLMMLWMGRVWVGLVVGVVLASYVACWWLVSSQTFRTGHVVAAVMLLPVFFIVISTGRNYDNTFSFVGTQVGKSAGEGIAARILAGPAILPDSPDPMTRLGAEEGVIADFDIDQRTTGAEVDRRPLPRVRRFFPETLLWRPELVTDDDGRASIEVTLPDSLTTWKLLTTAIGADGRLGAEEREFRVFQPFFVDFDLPVALTRNDEVEVRATVFNYLKKTQKVTLTLSDDPGIERLGGQPAEQQVEVPEGGKKHITYRLKAKKVGPQKLQILARGEGQEAADAVVRTIEVQAEGRRIETAWNGTLIPGQAVTQEINVPADAIEGSARAVVKIYPSSFSQLLEGLDGLFQMPHGCFEQTSSTTYPNILALDYLRRTKQAKSATEMTARGYVHAGYQRLLCFEIPGGGFDWFGQGPANRTLTAYGLMEFEDMARVYDVDPNVIERTRRWLLSQQRRDGSWQADNRLHDDPIRGNDSQLANTAYIAWAVYANAPATEDRGPTLNYLLSRRPSEVRDVHALALVCNALLAVDPSGEAARPYLDRLESRKQTDESGRFVFWRQDDSGQTLFHGAGRSGQAETTALAVLALLHDPARGGIVHKALAWLVDQKSPNGTWQSTQATILSLKALLAGTGKALVGDGTRRVVVTLNGVPVQTVSIAADKAEVLASVDLPSNLIVPGKRVVVRLVEETEGGTGYQVALRYHQPSAVEAGAFDLKLDYPAEPVRVGQSVAVKARLALPKPGSSPMVMLELPVPAGFAFDADASGLDGLVRDKKIARYELRSGWVVVYLTELRQGTPFELTYRLRALMPARVLGAGARAYEYYNPDQKAETSAVPLTITE